jgi:raffinose/stachyose/melibiose transport system substrate-binding protein
MKKVLSCLLSAAMLVAPLGLSSSTAMTASAASQKYAGQTLTVLTHWTDFTNAQGTGWLDKFAVKFKASTGATVKFQAITDYATEVQTRLSSGDYGDVLDIPSSVAITDLPSFFSSLGNSKQSDIKNLYYNYQDGIKNKDGSYTVYGLTYGLSIIGAVYNKAAFKKAGITKFPTTLNALYTDCAKLKAKGIVPIAINFKDKWPLSSAFDAMPLYASHDGNWTNTVYKTKDIFATGKPYGTALNILNKIVSSKWVENDLASTNWDQSKNDLAKGKDGMMFLASWAVPQMQTAAKSAGANTSDIGFAPIPTDNTGKLYTYASPDYMMGVSKHSSNVTLARLYLMDFINSDFGATNGFAPVTKGKASADPAINGFLKTGVKEITGIPGKTGKEGSNMTKISTEAGIDFWGGAYLQGACQAAQSGTFSDYVKTLNTKWDAAKKKLGF